MFGLPTEVSTWLLAQGPSGVINLLLLGVVIYLFKRWDKDREKLIESGEKYAVLATSSSKVIEAATASQIAFAEAMQTFKIVSDLDREKRR